MKPFCSTVKFELTPDEIQNILTSHMTEAGHIKGGEDVKFRFIIGTAPSNDPFDRGPDIHEFKKLEVEVKTKGGE